MKPCVFIHTNEKQWVGAVVGAHALRRNSATPDAFDVRFIHTRDHDYLRDREGQPFLRGGVQRVWRMDDLQSFTPLRFQPPRLMGYQGRAVLTDPDVFAVGDIMELLERDMQGAAVMGRRRSANDAKDCLASSVMLLDCAKLEHWRPEAEFAELFEMKRDYKEWMCLHHESRENIGWLEPEWNDFDRLTERTRLIHNTKRRTQPWKTGLSVDYVPADKLRKRPLLSKLNQLRATLFGEYAFLGHYRSHPDPAQEEFFYGLLRECLEEGVINEQLLEEEVARQHVRKDSLAVAMHTRIPERCQESSQGRERN